MSCPRLLPGTIRDDFRELTESQLLLKQMVLNSVTAVNTRRNYAKSLDDLFVFAAGRPLTRAFLQEWLLRVPNRSTLKGKRDYAVLALLVGCALRRRGLSALDIADVQQREGRWVIADLCGKGNRIRTVAIPLSV